MQLLLLVILLVGPYLVLSLVARWFPSLRLAPHIRARIGLSLFFLVTALAHFVRPQAMAEMLPPSVPYRVELIYLTGVFELLGAIGVWIPKLTKLAGLCLILMLIAVLPANIYSAFERVEFGGHSAGPLYLLLRIPFQILAIAWTYFATEQTWFRKTQTR